MIKKEIEMHKNRIRVIKRFELFDLHEELWSICEEEKTTMEVYRTKDGHFIACRHRKRRPKLIRIIEDLKISAEPISNASDVCSLGKSAKDGKWYGWSHRAMIGFGVGDRIFQESYNAKKLCSSCKVGEACEGEPCPSSIPFRLHGEKAITNDKDARKAAVNFAKYIS